MRVYELMPFFNELDLLELHLMETNPVVDHWVICELPRTFTGLDKPLHLRDALKEGRFDEYRGKMRLLNVSTYPDGGHPMVDWFQRRQLARGIIDANPDDLVVLTDLDEIPNCDVLGAMREKPPPCPVVLLQDLYYYSVSWKDPSKWAGTVVSQRKHLGDQPDTQELRDMRGRIPQIHNGGWHFSWLGSTDQILEKLRAVDIETENRIYGSDGIVAPPRRREVIDDIRIGGLDLFGREHRPKNKVDVMPGVTHPYSIAAWLEKYPEYA